VHLGRADMLGNQADVPMRAAFSVFERVRNRIARVGNDPTYGQIAVEQPGPMLMAAAMIIVSELCENWANPIEVVHRLFTEYDHPDGHVLWDRAMLSTYGFCRDVSKRLNIAYPEQATWQWLRSAPVDLHDPVPQVIPPEERLVAMGEWAVTTTPANPIEDNAMR
jgi:hypothetical protein